MFKRIVSYKKPDPNKTINSTLAGCAAALPFSNTVSGSRVAMAVGMRNQTRPTAKQELPPWITGFETQLAEASFMIRSPDDGIVRAIIPLYYGLNESGKTTVPETLYILQSTKDPNYYFCIVKEEQRIAHKKFGYPYVTTEKGRNTQVNHHVKEGDIFATSPSIIDGMYAGTSNARIALLSDPDTAEDAIKISDHFLDTHNYLAYTKITAHVGKDHVLCNLYGDDVNFKCYPDVGQKVNDDGLVLAIRPLKYQELSPALYSYKSLRRADEMIDKIYKVMPNSWVSDVRVIHNMRNHNAHNNHVEKQLLAYSQSLRQYNQAIYNWYQSVIKNGNKVELDNRLSGYVYRAYSMVNDSRGNNVQFNYKGKPVDTYCIEITVCTQVYPGKGSKWSGNYGDKGICCHKVPVNDMYRNDRGEVADLVSCSISTANRANPGRLHEMVMSTSAYEGRLNMIKLLGIQDGLSKRAAMSEIRKLPESLVIEASRYIWDFWTITSPLYIDMIESGQATFEPYDVVAHYASLQYFNYDASIENYVDFVVAESMLMRDPRFKPYESYLTYMDNGEIKQTKFKFTIWHYSVIALEKLGVFENAASGSSTLNATGAPARPMHNQYHITAGAAKVYGEDEMRSVAGNTGYPVYDAQGRYAGVRKDGSVARDMYEYNANPAIHRLVVERILRAPYPTNVEALVSDDELRACKSYCHNMLDTLLLSGGFKLERK